MGNLLSASNLVSASILPVSHNLSFVDTRPSVSLVQVPVTVIDKAGLKGVTNKPEVKDLDAATEGIDRSPASSGGASADADTHDHESVSHVQRLDRHQLEKARRSGFTFGYMPSKAQVY